jgi:hypothetical protein
MGIKPGQPGRAEDFIDESERSVDPADDEGKVVKLEDTGRVHEDFLRRREEFIFDEDGNFTVPDWGELFIIEIWGAGGSGGIAHGGSTGRAVASGGAGGQYAKTTLPFGFLNAGATIAVTVGAGGASVSQSLNFNSVNGNSGAETSFGDYLKVSGSPGGGASHVDSPSNTSQSRVTGNLNADADNADTLTLVEANVRGGSSGGANTTTPSAQDGLNTTLVAAGGGGAAVTNDTTPTPSGEGGVSELAGNGGDGASTSGTAVTASNGVAPGGGGGGATGRGGSQTITSGAGANGRVKITALGKFGE